MVAPVRLVFILMIAIPSGRLATASSLYALLKVRLKLKASHLVVISVPVLVSPLRLSRVGFPSILSSLAKSDSSSTSGAIS